MSHTGRRLGSGVGSHNDLQSIDMAVRDSSFEIVQWLHKNRPDESSTRTDGCTMNAINMAAFFGHLEVIKCIYDAGLVQGDVRTALKTAVRNCSLAIVRWFCYNHRDEITEDLIDEAEKANQVHIVQFLHDRCRLSCSQDALIEAAKQQHFAMLE